MKISVIGCGWYGLPLAKELLSRGHEVSGATRSTEKLLGTGIKGHALSYPELPAVDLLDIDVLVLNIPPFDGQLEWFRNWPIKAWTIFISSTGERDLLRQEENWVRGLPDWTILRFGGLVGPDRHPGNFLSGKKDIPGRLWPVNLLHLEDAVGFTVKIIESGIKGETINVVSDEHHAREEFYLDHARRNGLVFPEFDLSDTSTKAPVDNTRARSLYEFKWPTMIGRSL